MKIEKLSRQVTNSVCIKKNYSFSLKRLNFWDIFFIMRDTFLPLRKKPGNLSPLFPLVIAVFCNQEP